MSRFAVTSALNYAFGTALAWLLAPSEFGQVGALQNVLLFGSGILTAGFPWSLATALAARPSTGRSPDGLAASFRLALVANAALGAVLGAVIVGTHLAGWGLIPTDSLAVVVTVALILPVFGISTVLGGAMQGSGRFGGLAAQQSAEILVKCVAGLLLVTLLPSGALAVALAFLVGTVVGVGVGLRGCEGLLPGRGTVAPLRTARSAVSFWSGSVSMTLLLTADVLALGLLTSRLALSAVVIAAYQVCAILAKAAFYVGTAIVDAVFPSIAGAQDAAGAHRWLLAAVRWGPLLIVPIQLTLIIVPETVLALFFPDSYRDLSLPLRLVAAGTLGLIGCELLIKALYARRLAVRVGRFMPVAAVVQLPLLLVLVPRWGAVGAAVAYLVACWTALGLAAVAYRRHVGRPGARPAPIIGVTWRGSALTLAGFTAVLVLAALVGPVAGAWATWLGMVPAWAVLIVLGRRTGLLTDGDLARLPQRLRPARPTRPAASTEPARRWRAGDVRILGALAAVSAATLFFQLWNSPDTVGDEVAYVKAARTIASHGDFTWTGQPMFVHPPISFLLQAAWLRLAGGGSVTPMDDIHLARLLTATVGVLNVVLVALLAGALAHAGRPRNRHGIMIAAGLVMAVDPVVQRYTRLAVIEPFALCLALVTLLLAWKLRARSTLTYVGVVGLTGGLALLTKEVSIFLLATPALFGILRRDTAMIRRAAAALAVSVAFLGLFAVWAAQLGLLGQFVTTQTATLQRLLGLLQITGWNRPGVSFASVVMASAPQYAASYLLLAIGAAAVVWLTLRRNTAAGQFLLAWLITGYAFGAYCVAFGTLNEQFFVYLVPGAATAAAFAGEALLSRFGRPGRARSPHTRVAVGLAAVVVLGASTTSWAGQYGRANDGIARITQYITANLPACAVVNATGDEEKFHFLMPAQATAGYGVGAAALSRGIHYYLLSPNDADARYGTMSPQLRDWIRARGTLVAGYPSISYRGMQLWHVPSAPHDPMTGIEHVRDGVHVDTSGSRCGGFTVTNTSQGDFDTGYGAAGGKAVVGPPMTRMTSPSSTAAEALEGIGGRAIDHLQIFDGIVLATSRDSTVAASATASPVPITLLLARERPGLLRAAGVTPPTSSSIRSVTGTDGAGTGGARTGGAGTGRLTDPAIAARYRAAPAVWGRVLGPPRTGADGTTRQAFANAVLQHRARGPVVAAPLGRIALQSGLLGTPAEARTPQSPEPLPREVPPVQPSSIRPFVQTLLTVLTLYTAAATVIWRRRTRTATRPAAAA